MNLCNVKLKHCNMKLKFRRIFIYIDSMGSILMTMIFFGGNHSFINFHILGFWRNFLSTNNSLFGIFAFDKANVFSGSLTCDGTSSELDLGTTESKPMNKLS